MKKLLFIIIFFIAAVWIGVKIAADPGYALFAYGTWTVEMPLWLTFLILVILCFSIVFLWHLIRRLFKLPQQIHRWQQHKGKKYSQRLLIQGLIALTEGRWNQAEHALLRSVKGSELPVINYLGCARVAHEQHRYDARDNYLRLAHQAAVDSQFAVSLTQAQLQLSHKQFEQALATVKRLHELMPKHTYVLRLLKRLYVELKEWRALEDLIPLLRKYKVFKAQDLNELEIKIWYEQLQQLSPDKAVEANPIWERIPRALKANSKLIASYVPFLVTQHQNDLAEQLILKSLQQGLDKTLLTLYGGLELSHSDQQLKQLELRLKKFPRDPDLLLAAGRVAKRCKLWGKARSYFENCAAIKPGIIVYRELGELAELLNDQDAAFRSYRQALIQ